MIKKILVAVDGSELSDHALNQAVEHSMQWKANLIIVSVVPPLSSIAYMGPVLEYRVEYEAAARESVNKMLDEASMKIKNLHPDIKVETRLGKGRPSDVIMNVAQAEDVDLIGEGRVWSGVDAKKNGLIDDFGGLLDAIDLAAEIAGLEDYGLVELPYQKDPIAQLIEDLTAVAYTKALIAELGPFYNDYVQLKSILEMKGVQARLPYQVFID